MRYRTTFGAYAVILGLGPAGAALATASLWQSGRWSMVLLGVALLGVFGWVLLGTRYVVRHGVLDVRLGPLHRRISLGDITEIHRHRMLKGPTLGLGSDFIGIEYGEQAVNVSPKDAAGFIEAVSKAKECPGGP